MKLNFLKYLSPGYYAEKDSKEGLNCIKEFEEKAGAIKNKEELECLIQEYEKRLDSIGDFKHLVSYSPYLLAFVIPDLNIAIGYLLGLSTIQLSDWTRRVRRFKTNEGLWDAEKWTSCYPYKKKFEEKTKRLLEENL